MSNQNLINDYVLNVIGGPPPDTIIWVEDSIEMSEINPQKVASIYSLYEVHLKDRILKLIQVTSDSGCVIVEATPQVMNDVFPDIKTDQNNNGNI